jgi:hypothetical protein
MAEHVFVNLLRSPGIDSLPGRPVRQPYLSYRLASLHRLAELIPRNRFLGSLNVYKYGLCTAAGGEREKTAYLVRYLIKTFTHPSQRKRETTN